jgi:hypothetical protein
LFREKVKTCTTITCVSVVNNLSVYFMAVMEDFSGNKALTNPV